MNFLRDGSSGPQVKQVQTRLNEIFEEQLGVDGIYGEHTEEMVMAFQDDQGLAVDGIVGPATWNKLFAEVEEEPDEPEVSGVPEERELQSLYRKPRDPSPFLKVMDFAEFKPQFSHVRDYTGKPWRCRIYGHKILEAPLRQVFKNICDRGLAQELKTFDGCVCVRPKTSGNGWSTHAWGIAIDVNAARNGYGARPTLSAALVKCFTEAGFEWGGSWRTPDGMHFQFATT
jgi:hypothetical protein